MDISSAMLDRPASLPGPLQTWMAGKLLTATLTAQGRLTEALAPLKVTPAQYLVLSLLADVGPATIAAVADRLPQAHGAARCCQDAITTLDELLTAGLARRKEYRRGQREPLYYLTTAGRTRLLEASRVVAVADYDLSAHLSPEDRLPLRLLLDQLATGATTEPVTIATRTEPLSQIPVTSATGQPSPFPDGLTEREIDVLRLIGRGWTNSEIASALTVTRATVKTHVSHILDKLGMRSRTEAAAYAVTSGLFHES